MESKGPYWQAVERLEEMQRRQGLEPDYRDRPLPPMLPVAVPMVCIICGKSYTSELAFTTCSNECAREYLGWMKGA